MIHYMAIKLLVYIEIRGNDIYVGSINGNNVNDAVFQYDRDYVLSKDSRAISIALPLKEDAFDVKSTRIFFEGLLPEGFTRKCVANKLHAQEDDYLSILSGLGGECLGAIKILSEDNKSVNASYVKLSKQEVKDFAREGATKSADLVTKAHLSLAGASGKVGLYYNAISDEWFLPTGTAPSTHIVKQSHVRLKKIVANERLCLLAARNLGIDVPDSFVVKTSMQDDEEVLFATERYDRFFDKTCNELDGLRIPYRLHQEDFSQALGILPADKYEKNNAGYLKKMFELLRNYSANPIEDQMKLWDITIFNFLIGNTDNHIKNVSLLYSDDLKSIRLAPAYDIISTMIYQSSTENMSLAIDGVYDIRKIDREAFAREAQNIGIGVNMAMRRFDKMLNEFADSIEKASEMLEREGMPYIHEIKENILHRQPIFNLRKGFL